MSEEIIQASDLTRDRLKSILNSAFFEFTTDGDGDVVVREGGFKILILPSAERHVLTFLAIFGTVASASETQLRESANKVNDDLIGIRAYIPDNRKFCFDYAVLTDAGITSRQVVMAVRRFGRMLDNATDIAAAVLS